MLSDSQIRLIEQTPTHFIAYDPPYVAVAIAFAAFAIFIVLIMLFVTWKSGGFRAVFLAGYAAALILFLIGFGAGSTKSYISGSRERGTVQVTKQILGSQFPGEPVPLGNIQVAKVENVKNLRRLVVVLRTGEVIPLTSATDRDGYEQVAEAINALLTH